MMDCWSILEIEATSDITTIKRAYAKQLRKYHPEDDPEGFQRVREAYETAIKGAKELKKSVPIIENEDHYEETENKVIIRDTYTMDLHNIQKDIDADKNEPKDIDISDQDQKDLDIDGYKQKDIDINKYEQKDLDTKTNSQIENFKKVMTEFEFMEQVKAIYNNQAIRNDRDKWESLLSGYVFLSIDTSKKIYYMLSNFIQENHEISYQILVLLNNYFRWTERPDELVDIFFENEELISLAKSEQDIFIIRGVVSILYNEATYLRRSLGESRQALYIYGQIIELTKPNIDPDIDRFIAYTLYHRAQILNKMKKDDSAIADYDNLIKYYEANDEAEMKLLVARTLLVKAVLLTERGEKNQATFVYAKLINKYLHDTDEEVTYIVVIAQYNRAMCLRFLGKYKESFYTFKALIDTYSSHKNKDIKEFVKQARLNIKDEVQRKLAIKVGVVLLSFMFIAVALDLITAVVCEVIFIIISIVVKKVYETQRL